MSVRVRPRLPRIAVVLAASVGTIACESPRAPVDRDERKTASDCSPGVYGVAALDALHANGSEDALFFSTEDSAWDDEPAAHDLAAHLEQALAADLRPLPLAARIALQNDVWGALQRAPERTFDSGDAIGRIRRSALLLIQRLAPQAAELDALRGGTIVPEAARPFIDAAFQEKGTALPALSHENAFGARRVFRLLTSPSTRALLSQLIAVDALGRLHVTRIPGDLEMLDITQEPPRPLRVMQLDRRALRCNGLGGALSAKDSLHRIPSLGSNGVFVDLDPAVPLRENPCLRCHATREPNSLPLDTFESRRVEALLSLPRREFAVWPP